MKAIKTISKPGIICFYFLLLGSVSFGSSFMAVASGNWSSSTTWGGTAPSFTNTGDDVVIPSGITVTMDNNVTLNGAFSVLEVEGALSGASSRYLTVTTGTVSGGGSITSGWVTFGTAAILSFTGSISTDYYSNNAALTLKSTANTVVNKSMTLGSGILSIETGGKLTMSSNSSIKMSGGALVTNGGTLSLSSRYSVNYTSAGITGLELSGEGLDNVTINVASGSSVTLSSNMNADTLRLMSGTLVLNNNSLKISGDFQSSGNSNISSTSLSNISFNTSGSTTGYLAFASNGNTVKNLTINLSNGGSVNIDTTNSNFEVDGILYLTKGNLNIGNNTLTMGSSGAISGAGSSSYIVTGNRGYLAMSLTAGAAAASSYPIGTSTHYFPAQALLNSGSANGTIMLNAKDNVYAHGTSGNMLSATQAMVNATWDVKSDISSNTNMKLKLLWSSASEVNAFNRTKAYISHYSNSQWDVTATANASVESNGMYSISRDNLSSFSPFAVFDQSTAAIDNTASLPGNTFNLYPNPASDNIYISNKTADGNGPYNVDITTLTGQLVGTYIMNGNNKLNVGQLAAGIYSIRIYNQTSSSIQKLIKL